MQSVTNIVLLDHQPLFREGLKKVLESEKSFQILLSSDDYAINHSVIETKEIDVILMDVKVYIENKERIKEEIIGNTDIKIIVMSAAGEEFYVAETVKQGVDGYLLKEMDVYSFIDAIKTIKSGMAYVHPAVSHDLVEEYRRLARLGGEVEEEPVQRPLHLYTKRECEVLQLLTDGQSNREIAKTLNISEKTVKNHVSSLFKKMNVNDRTQAVVRAIRNNWVEL